MTTRLYVGNLPYSANEEEIRELFSSAGTVTSVDVPKDRLSGRVRGFAFVDMETSADAEEAIRKFNGYSLDGRALRVDTAKEREERPRGFGPPSGRRPEYGGGRRDRGREDRGRGRRMAA